MPKWNNLKGQILASTLQDKQGEKNTKEFLLSLCDSFNSKERIPLNQQHDMSLDPVGYIDNCNVLQSVDYKGEWNLVGDVYFHDVDIDEALKAFSYSVTEDIKGDFKNRQLGVYLPFPFYNDSLLINELLIADDGIVIGAWKKKCAEPVSTALIVSYALFLTAPAYTNYWNNKISPLLSRLLNKLTEQQAVEYVQTGEGHKGESFGIYFIPTKGKERDCLILSKIMQGLLLTNDYVVKDKLAKDKGVHMVKLIYSDIKDLYELKSIEYQDGSIINN